MRAVIETDTWPEADLRARELALSQSDTPVGRKLKELLVLRGHQRFMRGQYKLNAVMCELEVDPSEEADADVWILLSRGFQVHPEGFEHPVQSTENYASCDDFNTEFNEEMLRNIECKFAAPFTEAVRKAGRPLEKPVVTMALGIIVKEIDTLDEASTDVGDARLSLLELTKQKVRKSRIICDASCNGSAGGDRYSGSLNDAVDKQDCHMAGIEYSLAAASRHGLCFVVDESDCYLHVKVAAHSLKHLCFMFNKKLYVWTSMCFGLRNAPFAAQSLSNFLIRSTRRRLLASGLDCAPVAGGDQRVPRNRPCNDSGQMLAKAKADEAARLLAAARAGSPIVPKSYNQLKRDARRLSNAEVRGVRTHDKVDAMHAFLDDVASLARTPRAAWASFLTLLWTANYLGIPLNMKSHKSRSPAHVQGLLGCVLDLSAKFEVRLTRERVASLILDFDAIIAKGEVDVTKLMHLVGVLVWASSVVPARPYYRCLLDALNEHGYCAFGRYRKPAKNKVLKLDDGMRLSCKAWAVCLRHIGGAGIARGVRKYRCPYAVSSDACCRKVGSGWGWHFGGFFDHGLFPVSWAPFLDALDKERREIYVGYLEGAACLYALRFAVTKTCTTSRTLRVITDNQGLKWQLRKLSSRDPLMALILREIFWLLQAYCIELEVEYVPSHLNSMTDKLSRRTLHGFSDQDQQDLRQHARESHAVADVAVARGEMRPAVPVHGKFIAFATAERAQVLEPDAAWAPQEHTAIEVLLDEWRGRPGVLVH